MVKHKNKYYKDYIEKACNSLKIRLYQNGIKTENFYIKNNELKIFKAYFKK